MNDQQRALAFVRRLGGKNVRPGQSFQNAVAGDYFTENTTYSDGMTAGLSKLSSLTPANRQRVHADEPDVTSKERRARLEKVVKPRLQRRIAEQRTQGMPDGSQFIGGEVAERYQGPIPHNPLRATPSFAERTRLMNLARHERQRLHRVGDRIQHQVESAYDRGERGTVGTERLRDELESVRRRGESPHVFARRGVGSEVD